LSLFNRRYALYLASRVLLIVAAQMLSVAVGWQVYEITGKALALGFSGLALFLPAFLLALPAGHVADQRDRRRILLICHASFVCCATILAFAAFQGTKSLAPIYAVLVGLGAIRSFSGAAGSALMPSLVKKEELERAVAFGSSAWQFAMIAGPSLGGVIYAATGTAARVYVVCAVLVVFAFIAVLLMGHAPTDRAPRSGGPVSWSKLLAGIRYVRSDKPILGAISLDLFAVLLGGAVALLPMFARDVLHVGAWGLGTLRSAPAVGAATVALLMAWRPLRRRAGATMFACVFLFGIATIIFGISRNFVVSLASLVSLGAFDMVSVVVRSTLIQMRTPDEMRGRVSAVNLVFIGASNELGEFESGVTAEWLGRELAVVVGGIGTCVVVLLWMWLFPDLRKVDKLAESDQ
jgi:MFS family permease